MDDFILAGLRYRLSDVDESTREDFRSLLPEFRADATDEAEVLLCARRTVELPNPELLSVEALTARGANGRVIIRRCDFEGTWDPVERVARCTYAVGLPSLNCFLRVVSSFALLERGGVLVHASSVASGGSGFMFPGPSGAGKTTLARLGAPRPVLSDEVTALRPAPRPGAGGPAYTCFPTQFWGEMVRVKAGPSVPLTAIGFPVQKRDGSPALREASPSDAFARLLECVIAFDLSGLEKGSLLDVAADIVRAAPCLHVEYALDHSPWNLLDAFSAVA